MTGDAAFEEINGAKATMDHIYNQHDPRAYFRELTKLDYAIPGRAKPVFQKLIRHLQERRDEMVSVLDLGCSYGVNAALLKHDVGASEPKSLGALAGCSNYLGNHPTQLDPHRSS